jgi:LacI family transcriptional regulator
MDDLPRRRRSRQKLTAISLNEVAAYAEVSTATVSRVLNNSATVSKDVRRKVEQACQELGYVPNGAARALSSNRTMTIGAVVPTIENSGFALTVSSLQRQLNKAGYTLLLASSDYEPDAELRETRMLLMRGVDGIVLVGSDHHPQLLSLIEQHTVPFVETWTLAPGRPSVGFDNAAAAYELTEHIVSLGHTRIGLIAGRTSSNDRSSAREAGIRACLKAHGLALASEWFIERPYRILDGRQAMRLLIQKPDRPTAVICGNDQMAFGALIEASHQGFVVPDDISVAGFNDLEYAAHLNPPLTTIRVPAEEIGAEAARLLMAQIANNTLVNSGVNIPFSLVVRASTGKPPAKIRTLPNTKMALSSKK